MVPASNQNKILVTGVKGLNLYKNQCSIYMAEVIGVKNMTGTLHSNIRKAKRYASQDSLDMYQLR